MKLITADDSPLRFKREVMQNYLYALGTRINA
jgi:hypothetical protein